MVEWSRWAKRSVPTIDVNNILIISMNDARRTRALGHLRLLSVVVEASNSVALSFGVTQKLLDARWQWPFDPCLRRCRRSSSSLRISSCLGRKIEFLRQPFGGGFCDVAGKVAGSKECSCKPARFCFLKTNFWIDLLWVRTRVRRVVCRPVPHAAVFQRYVPDFLGDCHYRPRCAAIHANESSLRDIENAIHKVNKASSNGIFSSGTRR